jgi:hypothetical protein
VKIQILQEAKEELAGAIQYYEDITPGLGIRLKRNIHRCNCKQLQVSGFLDRKNEVISPDRI